MKKINAQKGDSARGPAPALCAEQKRPPLQDCTVCGRTILTMCHQGTPYCSQTCAKKETP